MDGGAVNITYPLVKIIYINNIRTTQIHTAFLVRLVIDNHMGLSAIWRKKVHGNRPVIA